MANSEGQQLEEGYQLCPFCKEKIRIGARKCRWCMEYLEAPDGKQADAPKAAPVDSEVSAAPSVVSSEAANDNAAKMTELLATKLDELEVENEPDEAVHFKMHPTYKRLLPPLFVSFGAIILSIPFLRYMEYSMYVLLLLIAFCLIWFLKLFIGILTTTYLLDDKRLVVSDGFFTRQRVEIRIEDIRAVWLKQNIIEQLLNIGDVQVGTSATAGAEISISDIDAPMEVHDLLRTLMN